MTRKLIIWGGLERGRLALLSAPLGYASLCYEQGQPIPLANDLNCSIFGGNHCSIFGGRGQMHPTHLSSTGTN